VSQTAQFDDLLRGKLSSLVADLYAQAGCRVYEITYSQFASILSAVVTKYVPPGSDESAVRKFCLALKIEELVLARACAMGNDHAWEVFFTRYREKLHDAALGITKDDSRARELAGSIYADLYASGIRDGQRVSKLNYYDGRGSLEGWLRIVLAQRHVNNYRVDRHNVSLEEENEQGRQFAATAGDSSPAVDPRLNAAADECLAALKAEDRCILAYYFLDDLTLAKIAATLGVHESTISRRLEKIVKSLRKSMIANLVRRGMSRRQAEEALTADVRDLTVDVRRRLTQDSSPPPFSKKNVIGAGEGRD
jgi:RNA polymerase sigma-70 factor, ECF subfamily